MRWLIVCLAVGLASAQTPSAEPSLLDKIKARAGENLTRLPNYTCVETIGRYLRSRGQRGLLPKGTDHVNVAYVGGRELYGRPGDSRIDEPDLTRLVGKPIEDGQFASFVKSIFGSERGTFGAPSETKLGGKEAYRDDYTIPLAESGYHVQTARAGAFVAYSGSFWVDRDTLDLMRLIVSSDLPPQFRIVSNVTTIDYGQISIGGKNFLLPLRSKWETKDKLGFLGMNVTTFENCHEFIGESVLKFGDPDSSPPAK